jgi:hypothetical protein
MGGARAAPNREPKKSGEPNARRAGDARCFRCGAALYYLNATARRERGTAATLRRQEIRSLGTMKLTLAITTLVVAAAGLAYFYTNGRATEPAPLPSPVAKAAEHRLTREGEFCLLRYASLKTASGVLGFGPGTHVTLVEDKGDTMLVRNGEATFEVASDSLTNDIDLAELSAKQDTASQQAYRREVNAAIARQNKMYAEHAQRQERAATTQQSRTVAAPRGNPLDRGAYNENKDVTRRPIIYQPVRGAMMSGWPDDHRH